MNPRISGSALLLIAALGCFATMSLAFSHPGDSSCGRSSWSTYRTGPTPGEAALCDADAHHRMHLVFGLLPVSLVLGAVGSLRFSVRPTPRPEKTEPQAPEELATSEPHSNVRTIPPVS